jgi:anaerobic magnesium-protoporphyrin IX monomethyl ester cyclase
MALKQLSDVIAGADLDEDLDALFVNVPLRGYSLRAHANEATRAVLGMASLATYAAARGFNVGVLDAEARGLGIDETRRVVNRARPRWAWFTLLAPTYGISATIAAQLDPGIKVMLGGHHASAMPAEILADPRMAGCAALVLGEGETRVAELLHDHRNRTFLPGVLWPDPILKTPLAGGTGATDRSGPLAPDLDDLPFADRAFLTQDPHFEKGRREAAMIAARGCPYHCSFCDTAVPASPDATIRTRRPENILAEMNELHSLGVTAFRFVDDLFLGVPRVVERMMDAFTAAAVGDWAVWDATGRVGVLHAAADATLDILAANGLREVALGIGSGSGRALDESTDPGMAASLARRLTERGIDVRGCVSLGFPAETRAEIDSTVRLVHELWSVADASPGRFRASAFEYRPYPGTPDWHRLIATGRWTTAQLRDYRAVDLIDAGVGLRLSDAPLGYVHEQLAALTREQLSREVAAP